MLAFERRDQLKIYDCVEGRDFIRGSYLLHYWMVLRPPIFLGGVHLKCDPLLVMDAGGG